MKKLLFIVGLCLLSCSNPTNRKYDESKLTEDIKAISESKKWSSDDASLFAGWLIKAKFTGQSLENKTYQEILEDAKKFKDEQKALADKVKKEAEARKQKMKSAITVTIYAKDFIKSDWERGISDDYNVLKYAIDNKSSKEIRAAKISFKIYNVLGDEIGDGYSMDFTDGRIAPHTIFQNTAGFSYNQFKEEDTRLANAKLEDLSFDFDVQKIVYSDGSVLE